ncbi:hypothetical protein FBQ97_18375, partial [Acidobacteria bacterium ACD]|nr:hypothetical protein [Acidobacteria bacterium ACD]
MKTPIEVPPGATAEFVLPVTAEVTVKHFHPEMPAVLGTPFLIYAMEVAASDAMRRFLPEGWVSVGAEVNVRHLAATPLGGSVTARATAVSVSGTSSRWSTISPRCSTTPVCTRRCSTARRTAPTSPPGSACGIPTGSRRWCWTPRCCPRLTSRRCAAPSAVCCG